MNKKLSISAIIIFVMVYWIINPVHLQAKGSPRIFIVKSRSLGPFNYVLDQIRKRLNENNVKHQETVFAMDDPELSVEKIIQSIKKEAPDLVFSIGTESTIQLSRYIDDIPIIFTMVYRTDIVEKTMFSKNNIKGTFINVCMKEPFIILKELRPELKKIGIIYSPSLFENQINKIEEETSSSQIRIVRSAINKVSDLPIAIKDLTDRVDAIYLLPDPKIMRGEFIKKIMLATFRKNLFVFGESYDLVKKGALLGFAFDINDVINNTYKQIELFCALSDIKLLNNYHCMKYRLFFNAKVADALGIKPNRKLLNKAKKTGKVIE